MSDAISGAIVAVAALWIALAIDLRFGEPAARWHPVVWMGRYLDRIGSRVAPRAGSGQRVDLPRFLAGTSAWLFGAAVVLAAACALSAVAARLPHWAAALLVGVTLKPLLAWRLLRDEVRAVEQALATSTAAARDRLARLVSRDVAVLDDIAIRESAIESLAENLNDSLVAPVFWFVLLGLPGAAVYRFANTADAMWGYRGERGGRDWEWAGKFAARADDVLSWLPARITAGLLMLCFAIRRDDGVGAGHGWRRLPAEARRTTSPNGGWPMAAMAIGLGVRLGKPGVYVLNARARAATAQDLHRAVEVAGAVVGFLAVLAGVALLVVGAIAASDGFGVATMRPMASASAWASAWAWAWA